MTSNINAGGIDANYPVAGQDNDTRGFRDNFGYIKNSLEAAKTEIEDLQAKVVLKGQLDNGSAVDNNLGGGSVYNGSYSDFHGETFSDTIEASPTDTINIDVTAGNAQVFTIKRDVDFTFRNWPGTSSVGKFATVRIHLLSINTLSTNAGSFVIGKKYTIISQGTDNLGTPESELTDFTLIGATNNDVGTVFTATGAGAGTGTARPHFEATFYSENGGIFHCEENVTLDNQSPAHPKIKVSPSGKHNVIEVWSVSNGNDLYVRYLGEF